MIFIDIETSGLDPTRDFITCIGILSTDQGILQFTHESPLWRENPGKAELAILMDFSVWVYDKDDIMVSYNGDAFDIPFLQHRYQHHKLSPVALPKHLDLFPFIQQIHGRRLSKDEAARKYCDLYVPSNSSGAFLSRIYTQRKVTFLQHMEMLQHNAIDLVTTARLYDSLSQFDDFQKFEKEVLHDK